MGNFSNDEKYKICRDWALKIFDKADKEDRDGLSNKATARTFYAAASFLDVLKQFHQGEGDEAGDDAVEEQKKSFYAKWKATEILKAIKEGREVKAGGYGEDIPDDDDMDVAPPPAAEAPTSYQGTEVGIDGSIDTNHIIPPPPPYPGTITSADSFLPPPAAPVVPLPNPSKPLPQKEPSFMESIFGTVAPKQKYQKSAMADAKELTTFAMKALEANDGALAVERLKEALECLGH